MFELHIEQGPILEAEGRMIGVVTGVQGMRWYEVTVTGQDAHTGATPMQLRKNALLGAARMIERDPRDRPERMRRGGRHGGLVEVRPNSRNVVPGEVFFASISAIRTRPCSTRWRQEFRAALPEVCGPLGLEFEEQRIWHSPAVAFDPELRRLRAPRARSRRAIRRATWSPARATTRPISRAWRRRR